jgi:hypothetical protein
MIPDGIYPGLSFQTYSTDPEWGGRMTPHALELALQTQAHVRAEFLGLREPLKTAALGFGSAFHCRLLEPVRFPTAYALGEQCTATTTNGARCSKPGTGRYGGSWLCSTHAPADGESEILRITEKEMKTINGMQARVSAHPAVKLLRLAGPAEVCIAWTCPRTKVACKSRLDKWVPKLEDGGCIILDLKSVESAAPRALEASIEIYGWARAGAMRQDGIEALTGRRPEYYLLSVEKLPPYETAAVMLDEETMRGARWEVRANLSAWAQCCKLGTWPGYGDDFVELGAPDWKRKYYRSLVGETQ